MALPLKRVSLKRVNGSVSGQYQVGLVISSFDNGSGGGGGGDGGGGSGMVVEMVAGAGAGAMVAVASSPEWGEIHRVSWLNRIARRKAVRRHRREPLVEPEELGPSVAMICSTKGSRRCFKYNHTHSRS